MVVIGNWWSFVLRGLVGVLFGLLTLFSPGMALATLVYAFGFYAIADGVFNIVVAFRRNAAASQPWWGLLLSGIFGIVAGFIALFDPGITAIALLYVIAAWAVVTGILEIAAAIRLRRQVKGEWLLALSGVLSVVFGVLIAIFPGPGALAVLAWIGAFATLYGILLIALGFRLRSWTRQVVDRLDHGVDARLAHGH